MPPPPLGLGIPPPLVDAQPASIAAANAAAIDSEI